MPTTGIESHAHWKLHLLSGFIISCDLNNFRSGAFTGRITATTTFEQAIEIFLRSDQLTSEEKKNYITPMLVHVKRCEVLEGQKPDERVLREQRGRVRRWFGVFPQEEGNSYAEENHKDGSGLVEEKEKEKDRLRISGGTGNGKEEDKEDEDSMEGEGLIERDGNVKRTNGVQDGKDDELTKVGDFTYSASESSDVEEMDDHEEDEDEEDEDEYPY